MRVALISSSLKLAGAEKQTVYITRALLESGVDARFFFLGEGGFYESALRQTGVPFHRIYKANSPFHILAGLLRELGAFRPHIVFAPQFGDLLQGGIAGRLWGALVLGGLRSDGIHELSAHGCRSPWMLRLAHGLLANSQSAVFNLIDRGTNARLIQVLPNVIDLREFDAKSRAPTGFGLPADRVTAVAVGRLQPVKRFDRFLEALALARRKVPALMGVIAGADRGCGQALRNRANELGLMPDHVRFLGECDYVPALLAQSEFLVVCSDYEGFPNVILEAMAARLPVITTRVGDAHLIVNHEQSGFVVDGFDPHGLASRMVQLAQSPEDRRRLGVEGRLRVAQEYSYESLAGRLRAAFHHFAAQHRRRQILEHLRGWSRSVEPIEIPSALLSSERVI